MKFFVTGVNGQLVHGVMNELNKRGHECVGSDVAGAYAGVVNGLAVTTMPYVGLDIIDKDAVEKIIEEVKPDAVIHCAVWMTVDMAEDDDKVEEDSCRQCRWNSEHCRCLQSHRLKNALSVHRLFV